MISRIYVIPKKNGVKFEAVLKPIATSGLVPEQKEDIKNGRARLIRLGRTGPIFFVKKDIKGV